MKWTIENNKYAIVRKVAEEKIKVRFFNELQRFELNKGGHSLNTYKIERDNKIPSKRIASIYCTNLCGNFNEECELTTENLIKKKNINFPENCNNIQ